MKVHILPNETGGWSMYPSIEDGPDYAVNTTYRIGNYDSFERAQAAAAMNMYEVVNRRSALDTEDLTFVGVQLARPLILYNVKRDLPGIPKHSTITAEAARAAGLQVPTIPTL